MPRSSNQVQDFPFTTEGAFPPLLHDKQNYLKQTLSSKTIRLSIRKLDGSTFDIVVKKKATVAKLKKAVEAAFAHVPKHGDCKISWSHVWGYFCLCFEHMKLLRDRHSITRYGIKNGDELQFVPHTPTYTVAGQRSVNISNITCNLDEPEGSSSNTYLCGDMRNMQNLGKNEVSEGYKDFCASNKHPTKRNYEVVRLGRPSPHDDPNSKERRDVTGVFDSYSTFSAYVGGFGYPTGYCLK